MFTTRSRRAMRIPTWRSVVSGLRDFTAGINTGRFYEGPLVSQDEAKEFFEQTIENRP